LAQDFEYRKRFCLFYIKGDIMLILLYITHLIFIILIIAVCFVVVAEFIGKPVHVGNDKLLLAIGISFSFAVLSEFITLEGMMNITENPPPGSLIIDWHPIPDIISFVLNFMIPLVLVALIIIFCTARNELKKKAGFIGAILSLFSIAGSIYVGQHMFTKYLGESLKEMVWWL